MKRIHLGISLTVFSLVLMVSCREEEIGKMVESTNYNQSRLQNHIGKITDSDIDNLHRRVADFSVILRRMYSDEKVVSFVNEIVDVGFYSDESIILHDLFYPDRSPWIGRARLKNLDIFRNAYQQQLRNLRLNNQNDIDYLFENGVSIYFPYSTNHMGKKYDEITIVMPPKEDTDRSEGIRLKKCGSQVCEEKVMVDDSYAMKHPTHIIYAGGVKVKNDYIKRFQNARLKSINTVYFGAVRINKQYDALISFTGNGGGPDLRIFRGSGYLTTDPNGQITNPSGDVFEVDLTRGQVNNCSFKIVNAIWDLDWKVDNFEQVLGIYDEDTQGEITFNGSLSTTLKIQGQNITGTVGYNIKRQSQDEIIRNWKISRSAFYAANGNSQGWGTVTGLGGLSGGPWAIWDGDLFSCSGSNAAFVLPTISQ